jgi:hypothetical protein
MEQEQEYIEEVEEYEEDYYDPEEEANEQIGNVLGVRLNGHRFDDDEYDE